MIRYQLPDIDELVQLGDQHPWALSIYVPTNPTPQGREFARTNLKSAVDEGIRGLRETNGDPREEQELRYLWSQLSEDLELWGNLSQSLVVFLAPGLLKQYVLPNRMESQVQFGSYFDITQLIRAVTTPQRAFALTLSVNGWDLWEASATSRADKLQLAGNHPRDAAEATNRETIHGPQATKRLEGGEGNKLLMERYSKVVGDAVEQELRAHDPNAKVPLFVFANDPLMSMIQSQLNSREVVAVHGSSDELQPDHVDEAIRARIGDLTSKAVSERANRMADGLAAGLTVTDVAQLAHAAVRGAVDTMIFYMAADEFGHLDPDTGAITPDPDGADLYSLIAIEVLRNSGDVIAVRHEDVWADVWNGQLLASLRYSMADQ